MAISVGQDGSSKSGTLVKIDDATVVDTSTEKKSGALIVVVANPDLPPARDKHVAESIGGDAAQTGNEKIARLRGGDRQAQLAELFEALRGAIDRGEFPLAKTTANEALQLARTLNDQKGEAKALALAGYSDYQLGDIKAARTQVREAKMIASMIGDGEREADCLNKLGLMAHDSGNLDEAHKNYKAALARAIEVGATEQIGIATGNIGYWQRDTGKTLEAVASYTKAAEIATSLGDHAREASWYSNIGIAYGDLGASHDREALAAYSKAAELARSLGDRWTLGTALLGVGRIEQRDGKLEEARAAFTEAASVTADIPMLAYFAPAHLGMIELAAGHANEAKKQFARTIEVTSEYLEGTPAAQLPLWYRAIARLGSGDAKGAMTDLEESFKASVPSALVKDIRNQLALLSSAKTKVAGLDAALEYLDQRA